jgi:hypothetical protein
MQRASVYNTGRTPSALEQGVGALRERDMVRHEEVPVRCSVCKTPYTADQTVRDFYTSDGQVSRGHEEPLSGVCPKCGSWKKEEL